MKTELQSAQQQVAKSVAEHAEQQEAIEHLNTALQTTQSQLAQAQSELQVANRLHETKIRELHERLKLAETVAATAAANQPITEAAVAAPAADQPIVEPSIAVPAPASSEGEAPTQYYRGPFVADQEVEARWKTGQEWISSRILSANADGTYRVVYEGQHVAGSVSQSSIRSIHPPPEIPSVDEIPEPPGDSDDPMVLFPGHKIVDVVASRHPTRGFGLKFKLINSGDVNQALYISEVSDPSSGLKASDKLYSVDGERATSFRGLKPLIAEKTEIKLRVLRASLVVQGVDLDSLSTIELKKMLRERNLDTKCNRAAAIKRLTMSLDNEADEEEPEPEETGPTTKFQVVAVSVSRPEHTLIYTY